MHDNGLMGQLNLVERIKYFVSNRRNYDKAKQFLKNGERSLGIKYLQRYAARLNPAPTGFRAMVASYKKDTLVRESDLLNFDKRLVLAKYLGGNLEEIQGKVEAR